MASMDSLQAQINELKMQLAGVHSKVGASPWGMTTDQHDALVGNGHAPTGANPFTTVEDIGVIGGPTGPTGPTGPSGESPVTHRVFVDANRVDLYVPDGSAAKPFLTIQAGISSCDSPSSTNPFEVVIAPGTYVEQLTLAAYVNLVALSSGSVFVTATAGDVVTCACLADMTNLTITYAGIDPTAAAIRVTAGGSMELRNLIVSSAGLAMDIGSSSAVNAWACTLDSAVNCVVVGNGGNGYFDGVRFNGGGYPSRDLSVIGTATVTATCQITNAQGLFVSGNITFANVGSMIANDSMQPGATISAVLNALAPECPAVDGVYQLTISSGLPSWTSAGA